MKKILMGSAVLTTLSISVIAFQMSCAKSANAQTGNTIVQQNKIIYTKSDSTPSPVGFGYEIWVANFDGTNKTKININMPSGFKIANGSNVPIVKLSPDGKTLFFNAIDSNNKQTIVSCNIGGGNATEVISNINSTLQIAY